MLKLGVICVQIQNLSLPQNNIKSTNFKSVYPVYYWHKPADSYVPAFDMKNVKRYQRMLTGILNSLTVGKNHKVTTFMQDVIKYIANWDKDYKKNPYVRTFLNYNGGIKTSWNGNVSKIEPCAYLLSGRDAVDFDTMYSKPIKYTNAAAKQYDSKKLAKKEIDKAKKSYGYGGSAYVKGELGKFKDENTRKPLELHVIIVGKPTSRSAKIYKIGFFPTDGSNNPFVTNGIL